MESSPDAEDVVLVLAALGWCIPVAMVADVYILFGVV